MAIRHARTPATRAIKTAGIDGRLHEYQHDPDSNSAGEDAAEKLGLSPDQVFKTLVTRLDSKDFTVALVPVSSRLDLKRLARAAGAKKAAMAGKTDVERLTGYVLGGVSPLGQKKHLPTIIDESARQFATIFVSAGQRGLELELSPDDLAMLCRATFAELVPPETGG